VYRCLRRFDPFVTSPDYGQQHRESKELAMLDDLDPASRTTRISVPTVGSASGDGLDEVLRSEARIVEMRTSITARAHFHASSFWGNVRLSVGGLAAMLSAIAGASALSQLDGGAIIAGALALAVTTLTAVTTFLNPSERANAHLRAGNAYLALENRARLFYRLELFSGKPERELRDRLVSLVEELNELNTTSPQPGKRTFKKARRDGFLSRRQLTTAELIDDQLRSEATASPPASTVVAPTTS
jgi:hypothetical protein